MFFVHENKKGTSVNTQFRGCKRSSAAWLCEFVFFYCFLLLGVCVHVYDIYYSDCNKILFHFVGMCNCRRPYLPACIEQRAQIPLWNPTTQTTAAGKIFYPLMVYLIPILCGICFCVGQLRVGKWNSCLIYPRRFDSLFFSYYLLFEISSWLDWVQKQNICKHIFAPISFDVTRCYSKEFQWQISRQCGIKRKVEFVQLECNG